MHASFIRPRLGALALAAAWVLAACGGGDATPPAESVPPTVNIASSVISGAAPGPVTFTFTFSEDVGSSFSADSVAVSNGSKGAFTKVSATQYTLVVTPAANSAGSVGVTIAANAVADLVGNKMPVAATQSQAFDTRPPTVAIASDASGSTARGNVTFTFSFSKDVGTTFTTEDVTVTGGTKGAFPRLSGTSATLVVTPPANSSGTIQLSMAAGAVSDAGGNSSAAASAQQAFDTAAPIVQTVLVNFSETPAPVLTGFGGAEDATVVADPTDASNRVAKVVKSAAAELWAGTTVSICPNQAIPRLPFSATLTTLTARVWSPAAGVPVRMKVEDAADGNKSVETEATTTAANAWQTLVFNFANPAPGTSALNLATTYNKVSVFFNFGTPGATTGARTYYLDDIAFRGSSFNAACPGTGGGGGATNATLTMDEAPAPVLTGFGGAEDSAIVADPTNAANKVARVIKSATAELWAGTTVSNAANQSIAPIGFSDSNKTITVRVWSPTANTPVRLKVENAADGSKSVETEARTTVAGAWQTLSFNFANQAAGTAALNLATVYNKLSIFFNFGTTGAAAGGARTYYFDDIVYPAAASTPGGGGGTAGPVTFASGYRQGGTTAQGGSWGYFSGDFANYSGNTFTGGGFADSNPPVADDAQFFFIALTTTAPTAQTGNPPTSGGFIGMHVTHPGLRLNGQTQLVVNLGMDANFFRQANNKNIDVFVVGATTYSNGSGGNCNVTLRGSVTPTTDAMRAYTLTLASMALVQPCNGGGFNSGVSSVAQALAQPIGAVNTQFTFPNVNTTINSGSAAAPVYATGITRGRTEFR